MSNTHENASHEAGRNNDTMKYRQRSSPRRPGTANASTAYCRARCLPRRYRAEVLPRLCRALALLLLPLLLMPLAACRAQNFTTSVQETTTQTWNDAIWEPGLVSPTAGNTYEVLSGGIIQTPASSGFVTFPGDSLTLDSGARIVATDFSVGTLNFPGVNGNPGLILNGGILRNAHQPGSRTFTIAGSIAVVGSSGIDHPWNTGGFVITAQLTGDGDLILINGAVPGSSGYPKHK